MTAKLQIKNQQYLIAPSNETPIPVWNILKIIGQKSNKRTAKIVFFLKLNSSFVAELITVA